MGILEEEPIELRDFLLIKSSNKTLSSVVLYDKLVRIL